jgi:hypothetical protein
MSRYDYIGNKRPKEHGFLIALKKDILSVIIKSDMSKEEKLEAKDTFSHEIGLSSWGSLENKFKRTKEDTDITVTELMHIQEKIKKHTGLKYLNEMSGFVMTATESDEEVTVDGINKLSDNAMIECNESFAVDKSSGKDGKYTVEEIDSMRKESMEAIEAHKKKLAALNHVTPVDIEEYKAQS